MTTEREGYAGTMYGHYVDIRDNRSVPFVSAEFANAWAVHRGEVFQTNDLTPFHSEWESWLSHHDKEVARSAIREDRVKFSKAIKTVLVSLTPIGHRSVGIHHFIGLLVRIVKELDKPVP